MGNALFISLNNYLFFYIYATVYKLPTINYKGVNHVTISQSCVTFNYIKAPTFVS